MIDELYHVVPPYVNDLRDRPYFRNESPCGSGTLHDVADKGEHRPNDEVFRGLTHERWAQRLNRDMADADYRDEWYGEQCGGCAYWIPLTGVLGEDYGACTNPSSPRDGIVQFEHDGCHAFAPVAEGEWGREPH